MASLRVNSHTRARATHAHTHARAHTTVSVNITFIAFRVAKVWVMDTISLSTQCRCGKELL